MPGASAVKGAGAKLLPFGKVYEDFGSAGFVIGNPAQDGIVWEVPFRFPGQYQDPEDELYNNIYYNWHRWYIPGFGRYNRADPVKNNLNPYIYANNNPFYYFDFSGLECTPEYTSKMFRWMKNLYDAYMYGERGIFSYSGWQVEYCEQTGRADWPRYKSHEDIHCDTYVMAACDWINAKLPLFMDVTDNCCECGSEEQGFFGSWPQSVHSKLRVTCEDKCGKEYSFRRDPYREASKDVPGYSLFG